MRWFLSPGYPVVPFGGPLRLLHSLVQLPGGLATPLFKTKNNNILKEKLLVQGHWTVQGFLDISGR